MAGFDVSALNDFVAEHKQDVLTKVAYEGSTLELATIQEGVKYKETINLLEVNPTAQYGQGCITTESGSNPFTQRDLEVEKITMMDGFCFADVEKKYLGQQMSKGSTYDSTESIMGKITDSLVNTFQKNTEMFLWDVDGVAGVAGLYDIISGSTAGVNVLPQAAMTTGTAVDLVDEVYSAIPTDVMDRDDLTIFMSIANFKKYTIALQEKNYFNNGDVVALAGGRILAIEHPFAKNVKVVGTLGLKNSNRIVAGPAEEIVVGTDLAAESTDYQLWYDINTDKVKYRLSAKFGANIAWTEHWVSNDLV